ncbi:FIP1[V]-like protein [Capsicum annuum]|uniref:FIP1[V]-like protein n=1 Tax=Capsicum annuum TaxID=4072 RepID=UPI001FB081F4|nr:FIP1[V]-like protein [Capsicum annuum]KAF3665981.1 FIP1[V]-like protein [Capsicum annuum]
MEDDDEFGDLYTDVLRPLTTSVFQSQPPSAPPQEVTAAGGSTQLTTRPTTRPIDLNINTDDDEVMFGVAPNEMKTLESGSSLPESNLNLNLGAGIGESGRESRVLEKSEDVRLPNFMDDEANIDIVVEENDEKEGILMGKEENDVGNIEADGQLIPGLSIPGGDANVEDDWDSDSEDDLQIVLNDNNHGPMGMEGMGIGVEDDEDDEDGEPLVIVADNDGPSHPPMMEEQEWGEEGGVGGNGERKEMNDALKVNGAPGVAPKVGGYSNHAYHHPYHSQYKYVRPGAAPMPGVPPPGPGGIPGQVRPPVNVGPVAGRGRGDWRPPGMKGGYGMPGWGGGPAGRGFGIGLEFTLPSHKTIFEVDIDGFDEKPWRLPGIDVTDFFNFGLNEDSWKDYCKQLEQLRLESTMQGRIRVYESGRAEQEYDPDLPPELAAAAGIQDIPSENLNGKTDGTSNDLARGAIRMRPPLPTGRPIQVETGSGDRLPSIDTRPPRQRDSDAIIEIVCQDDDQYTGDDKNEVQLDNIPSTEDFRGDARRGPLQEHVQESEGFQHPYKSHKRELNARRTQFNPVGNDYLTKGEGVAPFSSEAPGQFASDSGGQTSAHDSMNCVAQLEERGKKGSACDRSPDITPSNSRERLQVDSQKEESFESVDRARSPVPPSPAAERPAQGKDTEDRDDIPDQNAGADANSEVDREEMALDARTDSETMNDEFLHSAKKQKLSSRHEQSSPQETDDGEDSKAGRSSENSKVQSGSSRGYHKLRDDIEEEVVQDGRSMRMDNAKKAVARDEGSILRKKSRNEKEAEKYPVVVKGREDSYSRKTVDSSSAHYIDRRREREYSEGMWQRRDDDLQGRRTKVEEPRKRELIDEIGSRHRSKAREFEASDREERHLYRKQLECVTLRPDYDKDMGARHRDRDELKRYDTLDDRHNKRRKEEAKLSREYVDKEETFHSHGENMIRRKRERDDTSDHRKRDELMRLRDDEQHYIRHKEDVVFQRERSDRQREREEWYRLKQSHEETLPKREREEIRGGLRAGRVAEEKAWAAQSRVKDEYRNSDQHSKDVRHADHIRRRDRVENESPSRPRTREDERRARHDRVSSREDRAPHAPDNSRINEKRHKDYLKKGKEFEGDHNSQVALNMNEDDLTGQRNELVSSKGKFVQGTNENKIHRNRQSSRKHQEAASSDEEQEDSRRGRSKLERWTSHKERDFGVDAKSSSLNMKDNDVHKGTGTSLANKNQDEALKTAEDDQQPAGNNKNGGVPEINNVETKPMEDKHLETVEKLKKRSERFKLPMPSEKEAPVSKKVEGDPLSSVQSEIPPDSEVKPERPARRRRWTSN